MKDQKTAKLLERPHNQLLRCWIPCTIIIHNEEEALEQIFKWKLPFYLEQCLIDKKDPEDNKTAKERWKEVIFTFKDARLQERA